MASTIAANTATGVAKAIKFVTGEGRGLREGKLRQRGGRNECNGLTLRSARAFISVKHGRSRIVFGVAVRGAGLEESRVVPFPSAAL